MLTTRPVLTAWFIGLLFLTACGSNTTVYTGPSVDVGPVTISAYVNDEGDISLSGEYSKYLVGIPEILNVNWDVGFSLTLNEAVDRQYTLFILYKDRDGNIVQQEYAINQPFVISFTNEQWVKKIEHTGNGNIIVYVEPNTVVAIATDTNQPLLPTEVPSPRMYNFQSCLDECNGSNSTSTFPEMSTRINLEWQYENIPANASYIRYQTFSGMEWIRYDCVWPHSSSGTESVHLTEPMGLRSGDWVFTVMINGQVLLQETLHIQGTYDYWDPAGTLYQCYGTTD